MVANLNGVSGVGGDGAVWHFQDNGGWSDTGLSAVAAVVDARNIWGQEELFAQRTDGSVYVFEYASNQWYGTGGVLKIGTMAANLNGVSGVGGDGAVWHFQDNGGWSDTGLSAVAAVVDARNIWGQEELFAQRTDGSVYVFEYASNQWYGTGGVLKLSTGGGGDGGTGGGSGGTTTPLPAGLISAYKGTLQDRAADTNGRVTIIQPQSGSNIYLASLISISDAQEHNVAGNLTITSWGGDVISVRFVGTYHPGTAPSLYIENLSNSPGGIQFQFNFEILSNGNLYSSHGALLYPFDILDNNNGLGDYGASSSSTWYVNLAPNPSGTP